MAAANGTAPTARAPPRIRACILDMDGLLINSEDLITQSINEVLHEYGKPSLPWSVKVNLQGRTLAESSRIFQEWAQLPISDQEFQEKLKELHTKLFPTCQPLPGVQSLLEKLSHDTAIHLALATSSRRDKFELKTAHLQPLFSAFQPEHIILGDDPRIAPGRHKPCPDIYTLALQCINATVRKSGGQLIQREECLVFEDAVQGVEAGRRAGMHVIWCPHEGLLEELERAGRVDKVLAGPVRQDEQGGDDVVEVWPARLVRSLEGFDGEEDGVFMTAA
ncbi:hypothetical protein CLAFUW4_09986 [Fulvia fulva]|uniref:Uncharacterized protein n=1 Tax=Passalora fulva TaxID=5499 RepID=A0A9Q8UUI2_PASFU|nr:uncharacterized protein CLAFUR5_12257 [Fulvia fulva]KAK4615620.1 hypothetical protein CLAFUR4_09990 [Fulvia fulva]KAK4617119.1 hypothetical protein CLAFUR0_09987 [Fulvia fulva]UJO22928.1 hypothetical protein CLAFUR5_12257 [Fulvia fulva]WPV19133.1 hypothetical protein CLAFUW4_09986 [Fulvia fulva]WPV34329.1 hypothetical protein CLAFUW7_09987 [Fulvia fulva]